MGQILNFKISRNCLERIPEFEIYVKLVISTTENKTINHLKPNSAS